ncbi:MAG: DUF3990 domain-containing protein [Propionibacteriaceae bacterium]|jgi:hypothetical protein|nr:DUF3990 domain-containing protein [Propionibacteriaceae bacterium]
MEPKPPVELFHGSNLLVDRPAILPPVRALDFSGGEAV